MQQLGSSPIPPQDHLSGLFSETITPMASPVRTAENTMVVRIKRYIIVLVPLNLSYADYEKTLFFFWYIVCGQLAKSLFGNDILGIIFLLMLNRRGNRF
jgi:hypothetical protein